MLLWVAVLLIVILTMVQVLYFLQLAAYNMLCKDDDIHKMFLKEMI